jgi:chaperone required for assembly of F1-ATPase
MAPTKVLRSPEDIAALGRWVSARKSYPLTVTVTKGASRSSVQNRLAQRWFTDVSRQLEDQTHGEVRAYCKLHFGVPILRAENEAFRQSYDATMLNLPYETKLEAVKAFDLPVTRLMTVKQMTAFMDEVQRFWSEKGVRLTDPEALKYEEEFA